MELPLSQAVTAILCLLWFVVSFVGAARLGRRFRATIADLFLAGAVCWEVLGIYFREVFETPGLVALSFAAAGVLCYRVSGLSEHRVVGRVVRVTFWLGFICAYFLFNLLFEGKR